MSLVVVAFAALGEQHLDTLAVAARLFEGFGLCQRSSYVAGVLAHDPASGHIWAAFGFEWARPTHRYGYDVADPMIGADCTRCPQKLARRTGVEVARLVEGEVLARKGAILTLRLVDDRNMRRYLLLMTSQFRLAADP